VSINSCVTFADGMAVRVPSAEAFEIIRRGADHLVEVSDDEIAEAMRVLYADTHTLAEGAGAAAFAALMKESASLRGRKAGAVVSGQNIDRPWMATVLSGGTPQVA
jgi:threonine dehydratase